MLQLSSVGFRGNKGSMVVRLYIATDLPVEGIYYYCQIEDDTDHVHNIDSQCRTI